MKQKERIEFIIHFTGETFFFTASYIKLVYVSMLFLYRGISRYKTEQVNEVNVKA